MNVGILRIVTAIVAAGLLIVPASRVDAQPMEEIVVDPDIVLILDDRVPADLLRNGVIRSGTVRLPADSFVTPPPSDLPPEPINIPIDHGRSVSLVEKERRTGTGGRTYVIGVDQNTEHSRFVMLIRDGALVSGEIRLFNEVINLTGPVPDSDDHVVFRMLTVDLTNFPAERAPVELSEPDLRKGGGSAIAFSTSEAVAEDMVMEGDAGEGPYVEVKLMVVYTPAAADAVAAYYTDKTIQDKIIEIVDAGNWGLQDQANITLNLVHMQQVDYKETGDIYIDLKRLECPCDHRFKKLAGDNHLNEIFPLWKQHEADIVSLWVDSEDESGIANIMEYPTTDYARRALNVVSWQAATQAYTFYHEIGHNFSARHNWAMDPTNNKPYSYNHGYVNTANEFVTMMSYASTCLLEGFWCYRSPVWSDPTLAPAGEYGTAVPGPLAANNAQALVASSPYFSNFDLKHDQFGCCVNYGNFFFRKYAPGPCT